MPYTSSSRIIVITLILIAFAAFTVSANWGSRFGYSRSALGETVRNEESSHTAAEPQVMTTPLNAITSFDAALISRYVIELPPPLIANQLTVADVSGVGNRLRPERPLPAGPWLGGER